MAQAKFIEFTLEGDPVVYKLVFDVNEIAEVEKETGLNLLHSIKNLDAMSMLQFRALLWALLRPGHKSAAVTLKEAGELIGRNDPALHEAFRKALGIESEERALIKSLSRIAEEYPEEFASLLVKAGIPFQVSTPTE